MMGGQTADALLSRPRFLVTKSNLITLNRTPLGQRREQGCVEGAGVRRSAIRRSLTSRDVMGVFKQNVTRTDGRARLRYRGASIASPSHESPSSQAFSRPRVREASALTSKLTIVCTHAAAHSLALNVRRGERFVCDRIWVTGTHALEAGGSLKATAQLRCAKRWTTRVFREGRVCVGSFVCFSTLCIALYSSQ